MTQGTLIRELCTYTTTNPTRQAVFEYDRLVRSIYTLKYLRVPELERSSSLTLNKLYQLRIGAMYQRVIDAFIFPHT
jgi:TnpA family transposase